ncbi:MAG: Gfo/Idh/MocA family oxidoreductase [Hyphomicrobiales bacterium]|nr:Gfo/Idh/MocA family oxidoreductase [Hyphomicrobiales bacterium]
MKRHRMLILGAGSMAATHARAFQSDPRVEVVAACDVDAARAAGFAAQFGLKQSFGSLEAALAGADFSACANVTPDGVHHASTMALLAAGKHVFCEKPLADTYPLALEMTEAAEAAGVINRVNLTYRNVPQLAAARALVASGALGDIRHLEASYRQSWLVGNHWGDWRTEPRWLWRLSQAHGSRGVLGDVGVHILDFATHAAGEDIVAMQAQLQTFAKAPDDRLGDYRLDANDSFTMNVRMSGGALGVIHASRFMTGYANSLHLHIFGTKGALELHHGAASSVLRACTGADVHNLAWREIVAPAVRSSYQLFVDGLDGKSDGSPDFRRAAVLQKLIDASYGAGPANL